MLALEILKRIYNHLVIFFILTFKFLLDLLLFIYLLYITLDLFGFSLVSFPVPLLLIVLLLLVRLFVYDGFLFSLEVGDWFLDVFGVFGDCGNWLDYEFLNRK